MTGDQFRDLVLTMPEVEEGSHMGHPDFRVNGRVFATLHPGERTGVVKLSPDEQAALVTELPSAFQPANGAWGRQGYTTVVLEHARAASVRGAVLLAWQAATARPPARKRKTPGGRRKS